MRDCELCGVRARVHCEADQARLCWDCDGKVHGANFLVAKHQRSLLCHGCQSPTPWTGSGPKLTPTVSVCDICVERRGNKLQRPEVQESEAENDGDEEEEEEEEEDDGDDCDESDEDENQVVPWSCCSYSTAEPPPAASCSSSEEEEDEEYSASKLMRENADGLGCDETASLGSLRMLKRQRLGEEGRLLSQRSTARVSSIRRLGVINDGDDCASARDG